MSKKSKTEFSKHKSIMARLDYRLKKAEEERVAKNRAKSEEGSK